MDRVGDAITCVLVRQYLIDKTLIFFGYRNLPAKVDGGWIFDMVRTGANR